MTTATLYCDESGATGNDLLNPDQRYFTYSSVVVDPAVADELVAHTKKKFHLQGELKGANLLKYSKGREAIAFVMGTCDTAAVAVSDKWYSLACKFYQYTFEDVLWDGRQFLEAIGFPRFISNALFIDFDGAKDFFGAFQELMGVDRPASLEGMLRAMHRRAPTNPFLAEVLTFCRVHRAEIEAQLEDYRTGDTVDRWVLELTHNNLIYLLTHWGERFDALDVCCDRSGPLTSRLGDYDEYVNRPDRPVRRLGGREVRLGCNLVAPVRAEGSRGTPGLQIADLFASSVRFGITNPRDDFAQRVLDLLGHESLHPTAVPDSAERDLREPGPFVNAMVFKEIVERSREGRDLLEGIDWFVESAARTYEEFRATLG